jgi:serine/threonine-protein kinase
MSEDAGTPLRGESDPADLLPRLTRELGATLRFDRELGGGGMSRVFLATDPALDRRVVVKVVSATGGALSLSRFRREMLMAAALHHPHIVPILATGEVDGTPWYSMPYIEGRSLRDRLANEGQLPIRDILRILRDAARACTHAHEHGVVHRDLKPENILLAGDGAMIIDFGIARALAEGHRPEPSKGTPDPYASLTQAGFTLGTPTYMAPEQAAADPNIDHRADLYSLGVVAFELTTGRPPFRGASSHEVLRAHLSEPAPKLDTLRADAPDGLVALVAECLAKSPRDRPQSAGQVVERLEALLGENASGVRRGLGPSRRMLAFASAAAIGVAAIGLVGWRLLARGGTTAPAASVAVLPFVPRGDDSASAWLATGLSDDLSAQLENVPGLYVAARLSVDRLGRAPLPPRQLAETLGVRTLLDGVVRRDGNDLKVIAQLVDAKDARVLWTGTYQTSPDSTAQIVQQVLGDIRVALLPAPPAGAGPTIAGRDPAAYQAYLRGRSLLRGRTAEEISAAVAAFQHAIERDSLFASAHSGLADALLLEPLYAGVPTSDVIGPAAQALDRALALDSNSVEARLSRANLHKTRWQWGPAVADLEAVLALGPNAPARQALGEIHLLRGHPDSAFAQFEQARATDPGNTVVLALAGVAAALMGNADAARARVRDAVAADSLVAPVRLLAGTALLYLRDVTAALPQLRAAVSLAPGQPLFRGILAQALAMAGDRAGAEAQRALLRQGRGGGLAGGLVHASLAFDDTAAALDALEQAEREQDPMLTSEPLDSPLFRAVAGTARFRAVRRALGF